MIKLTPEEEEKAKETRRALLEGAAKVGSMGGVVPEVRGSITEPQGTLQAETSAPGGITKPTMVSPMPPAGVPGVTAGGGVTAEPASPVPGVTATPATPAPATPVDDYVPRPSTAAERAGWDKSLKEFREGIAAEEAKRSSTYTPTFTNESLKGLETVPGWYKRMDMATGGGKPGYGAAMDAEGHITVGTPSGRIISTRPGAAIEDAQQEILNRVNYLQNTPVEKQYQDYLAENKRQYPKGPITTKLNEWGTTSTEGEPLNFKTFKAGIGRRIDDGLGSLERLSGTKKEAPSAVPRPFEFSTDYQNLYGKVKEWLQRPKVYKKELAVAVPLLDKIGQREIDAYRESGATGSLGITPKDAEKIAKDVSDRKYREAQISVVPSEIKLREAQAGESTKRTEAIPSNIEKTKAETAKLIREAETKTGSAKEEMGLLAAALKAVEDEVLADPTTKASNAEMRKLIMARIKEILGGKTAGEEGQTKKPTLEESTAKLKASGFSDKQIEEYHKIKGLR